MTWALSFFLVVLVVCMTIVVVHVLNDWEKWFGEEEDKPDADV